MAKEDDFKCINVKMLAKESGIPYTKLRNCIIGKYSSLSDAEKTRIFNTLQSEVTKSFAWLGFSYDGRRIKVKE